MTSNFTIEELEEKLRIQILRLNNQCRSFDNGFYYSALDIAVTLRLLFHHIEDSSHSLLEQLGKTSIQLVSSGDGKKDHSKTLWATPILTYVCGNGRIKPKLDKVDIGNSVPFQEWWELDTVCFLDGHKYTRKEIVLYAANLGDGAHVNYDKPCQPTTQRQADRLRRKQEGVEKQNKLEEGFFVQYDTELNEIIPMPNDHFPMLRQIAYEVLVSGEFTILAGNSFEVPNFIDIDKLNMEEIKADFEIHKAAANDIFQSKDSERAQLLIDILKKKLNYLNVDLYLFLLYSCYRHDKSCLIESIDVFEELYECDKTNTQFYFKILNLLYLHCNSTGDKTQAIEYSMKLAANILPFVEGNDEAKKLYDSAKKFIDENVVG